MNTSLLIDYNIIKKNMNILTSFTKKLRLPDTSYSIGIILIITKKQLEKLNLLPKGIQKINYLNDTIFINSIIEIHYIIYNDITKICELLDIINDGDILSIIMSSLLFYFSSDTMIWTRITENNYQIYINEGFNEPFLCGKTPLNTPISFDKYLICMYKRNISLNTKYLTTKDDLLKTVENFKYPVCVIKIKFIEDTLLFLKQLCINGEIMKKNGKILQKEISGSLNLTIDREITDDLVYNIEINKESIIIGKKETVSIAESRYNFHSHPKQAYIRHDVIDGHPSAQDFLGYLQAIKKYRTVFHCVSTLEGIYIISLQEYWCDKFKTISESFILKKFDIDHLKNSHNHNHKIEKQISGHNCSKCSDKHNKYIDKVNTISFKNKPIFIVKFLRWKQTDITTEQFTIFSPKIGVNCFVTDESYKLYKKFYNETIHNIGNPIF